MSNGARVLIIVTQLPMFAVRPFLVPRAVVQLIPADHRLGPIRQAAVAAMLFVKHHPILPGMNGVPMQLRHAPAIVVQLAKAAPEEVVSLVAQPRPPPPIVLCL